MDRFVYVLGLSFGATITSAHRNDDHVQTEKPSTAMNVLSALFAAPALRRFVTGCVAAVPILVTSVSHAQMGQIGGAGDPVVQNGQQNPAPVNPAALSCNALKAKLQTAGELSIVSGPKGAWGDTFYGPAVPRCQFWQMPVFTYVTAADGLCGVGYICVDKLSFD